MFTKQTLSNPVEAVRKEHAPDALVLSCDQDFETVPSAQAEDLLLLTDSIDPVSYDPSWIPPDSPEPLVQYASDQLTIGMPGDGGIAWTRQTEPPLVFEKPRLTGSPESFIDFLRAEALVQIGLEEPEHFLGFFGSSYPEFADATADHLSPAETYQLAAACYEAYLGLQTRAVFADWEGPLFDAWVDAGQRLEGRLSDLPSAVAQGRTSFTDAAELACSAIKHAAELPAPFGALNASVYLDHGPEYATAWAERTLDAIAE